MKKISTRFRTVTASAANTFIFENLKKVLKITLYYGRADNNVNAGILIINDGGTINVREGTTSVKNEMVIIGGIPGYYAPDYLKLTITNLTVLVQLDYESEFHDN